MAVMFKKGQQYDLLKTTYSVSEDSLKALAALGVTLSIGNTSISLDNGKGLVKEHSFNTLVNNTVKNPDPKHIVEVNAFVANFIKLANTASTASIPSSIPAAAPYKAPKIPKTTITQADIDSMPVVQLRDATAMYQKVHGTSTGSVYRVVAMNDAVKVAVRITGIEVSVRVEGIITAAVEKAFGSVGLAKKSNEYMSHHFKCVNCTPHKLVGSILSGCGLEFDTPVPVVTKVLA